MGASHVDCRIGALRLGRWSDDAGGDKLIAIVRWQRRSAHLTTHCAGGALPAFGLTLLAALFSLLLLTLAGFVPDNGEGH
jgi:hypothetical protein